MFSIEQHNPHIRRRVRQHTRGRYPQYQLVSPGLYGMSDDGLGDIDGLFSKVKSAVKSVVTSVAKNPVKAVLAPVAGAASIVVAPVLKAAEKIPVVGSVVKIGNQLVDVAASTVGKIPIIGAPSKMVLDAMLPTDTPKKKDLPFHMESPSTPVPPPVVQLPISVPDQSSYVPPAQPESEAPQTGSGHTFTGPQYANIPGAGGAGFLTEDRNYAPGTYEDTYAGTSASEPIATESLLLYGGLALGGVVLITLLTNKKGK